LLRKALIVAAAACVCALAAAATAAGRDPWLVAQHRLAYRLYEPRTTFALKLSRVEYPSCAHGRSADSFYTDYGGRLRGFELVEGSPQICANAATFTPVGARIVGSAAAHLGVYCRPDRQCSLDQGYANGYALFWSEGRTRVQINSRRLTLAQLLQVATSLRSVR
jgi:hypothetical protein